MLFSFCGCVSGIHMYMCVYTCEGQWFTLECHPQSFYTLFTKAEFVTEPRAH